jgi:hypothetical protein
MRAIRGHRSSLAVATALLMTLALSSTVTATGWTAPTPLGPWGTGSIELIELDGGQLVAGITSYRNIFVVRSSTDLGQTWGPPVRLAMRGGSYAMAGGGHSVDVVRGAGRVILYARSSDGGATFSRPTRLNSGTSAAAGVAVARDGDTVVVGWVQTLGEEETPGHSIVVRVSNDGGQTFGTNVTVDDAAPGNTLIQPTLHFVHDTLLIAYGVNGHRLVMRRSLDDGQTWSPPALISQHSSRPSGYGPTIESDGSTVYVGFTTGIGHVTYRRSTDAGATWSGLITIATARSYRVALAAHDGGVDAAWVEFGTDLFDEVLMYRRSADGLNWGPARKYRGISVGPRIVHADSTLVMLYTQVRGDTGRAARAVVTTLSD